MTAVGVRMEVSDGIRNLGVSLSRSALRGIAQKVSDAVARKLSAYIGRRAPSRHKSALALGAKPTGILEFAEGNPAHSRGGGIIRGYESGGGAVVTVENVPGIARAFKDLDIYPRRAKALTIPISAVSYSKTAGELEKLGWRLFVPRRRRSGGRSKVLMGKKGSQTIPLFAFARHVHIRRDAQLFPQRRILAAWANEAACIALKESME